MLTFFLSYLDLVVMTKDQEERAIVIESEKQRARELCSEIFSGSMSVIRSCDIPFQESLCNVFLLKIFKQILHHTTSLILQRSLFVIFRDGQAQTLFS